MYAPIEGLGKVLELWGQNQKNGGEEIHVIYFGGSSPMAIHKGADEIGSLETNDHLKINYEVPTSVGGTI